MPSTPTSTLSIQEFRNLSSKKRSKSHSRRSVDENGVKYDSETERDFHAILTRIGVVFEFQKQYVLFGPTIPKGYKDKSGKFLLFEDRCAEAVTLTVDFEFTIGGIRYIVDTKGSKDHITTVSKLKYDILKHRLHAAGESRTTKILFVSKAEVKVLGKATVVPEVFWAKFKTLKERI